MHPRVIRIDKNIQIIFEMKKKKAMKNSIARIFQGHWREYC